MPLTSVHDKQVLAELFMRDPELHAYELGDLDDSFWPFTTWYQQNENAVLIYHGVGLPILLALATPDRLAGLIELLEDVLPLLPHRVFAHISAGAEGVVAKQFHIEPSGLHLKMALGDRNRLTAPSVPVEGLDSSNLAELVEFYATAYPGNSFHARALESGQYVGIRRDGKLVAVAGVHIWSPTYRVATLGNVTTHPDLRGSGLGKATVTALCLQLLETVDHIALNVKADNASAVGLYAGLGFRVVGEYHELMLTAARQ